MKKLKDYELFCRSFPEFLNNKQIPNFKQNSEKIIRSLFLTADNYTDLTYILKTYGSTMGLDTLAKGEAWENRIWQLFNSNPGISHFYQFVQEHPYHKMAKECGALEYATMLSENSLASALQFVTAHPLYGFTQNIEREKMLEHLGNTPGQIDKLSAVERRLMNNIIESNHLIAALDSIQEVPDTTVIIDLMKRISPVYTSYLLFDKAFRTFKSRKKYDEARALVREGSNLYKNTDPACSKRTYPDSSWFSAMSTMLSPPAERLVARQAPYVNTENGSEYLPILSPDKRALYFIGAGRSDGYYGEDPYEVNLDGVTPGTPRLVEELASRGNEAILSITSDGKEALVFIDGGLYTSEKRGGKWSEPLRVNEISDQFAWVGTAQITGDGGVMLFEGRKRMPDMVDLYISFRQNDGKWGEALRLPDNINTAYDDRCPSIFLDGKIMYYSTAGHEGFGEMDVFKTTRLDDSWMKWSDPVNLGRAINTDEDEWGFNFAVASDGKTAFFAKKNGNLQDLMMTELPVSMRISPIKMIKVPVKSVDVTFLEVRNSAGDLIQSIRVKPGSEEVLVSIPEENWNEKITITPKTGDDVITSPVTFDMKKPPAVLDTVMAIPVRSYIENRENFKIGAVQFDLAESELNAEAKVALDKFCRVLGSQKVSIFITGHTDDNGSESDNQKLSEKRVAAVKSYMVSRGIPEKSITATGKGETEPKVPNTSDQNRAINRRVEFRLE
jgi:outer membrane protein OmpA-like peptidoglycan-associated protein